MTDAEQLRTIREHARKVAASAPPLTEEQRTTIRLAFASRPLTHQEN
ncbi:hypothetical protein RND64_20200 [Gordonia sp. w5E2]